MCCVESGEVVLGGVCVFGVAGDGEEEGGAGEWYRIGLIGFSARFSRSQGIFLPRLAGLS